MGVTVEDAEVSGPRADGFAVLMGHDAGDLVEMRQIVSGPSGEKLGQGDRAELGMKAATSEVLRLEVQGGQRLETLRAKAREFVEKRWEGLAVAGLIVGEAVESIEGAGFAVIEDHAGARNPVGKFAMDQVTDDVEGRPSGFSGVGVFVGASPGVGQVAEE